MNINQLKRKLSPKRYRARMSRFGIRSHTRLTSRLTFAAVFVVLITTLVIVTASAIDVHKLLLENVRTRLHDIVSIAALELDGELADLHSTLQDKQALHSEAYQKIAEKLTLFVNHSTDISTFYTMRKLDQDKKVVLVIGHANGKTAYVGETVDHIDDKFLLNFDTQSPRVCVKEHPTHGGRNQLSAYAQFFRSDGTLEGIIGADIHMNKLYQEQYLQLFLLLLIGLLATAISGFIGFVLAKQISNPLTHLYREMESIRRLELETPPTIKTDISEIAVMDMAVQNMRRGLRSFRKYVPSELVRQLVTLGFETRIGGEHRVLTIFFSDIAGFTPIAERLDVKELADHLAEYLGEMTNVIHKYYGTVDKYIGDAIMAFWGAPTTMENHALLSCKAALESQSVAERLNKKWKEKGIDVEFNIRIGISTGNVIVGNFGSEDRLNYTVLGDTVNIASRLEQANKHYNTKIMISEFTYEAVKDYIEARIIDKILVKGKNVPLVVYELIALKGDLSTKEAKNIEIYNRAFRHYLNKEYDRAFELLGTIWKDNQDDLVIKKLGMRLVQQKIGMDG